MSLLLASTYLGISKKCVLAIRGCEVTGSLNLLPNPYPKEEKGVKVLLVYE